MKRPGRKDDRSTSHSRSRMNVAGMTGSQYGSSKMSVARASQALLGKLKAPEINITVLDDDGFDVTPLSLLGASKGIVNKAAVLPSAVESSVITRETVADVLNNLESLNSSSWANSGFGKSAMSQTSKTSQSETSEGEDDGTSSAGSVDSIYEKDDLIEKTRYRLSLKLEQLESDPNKYVHINLAETDTITLFDLPSLSVSNEAADDLQTVKTANARYKDLKSTKVNNDNFVERGMQTFNNAKKNKDIQATAQKFEDAEVMANVWSIFDALNTGEAGKNVEDGQKDNETEAIISRISGDASLSSNALINGMSSSNMIHSKTVFGNEDGMSETIYTSITSSHISESTGVNNQEPATISVVEKDLSQLNQKTLLASLLLMEKAIVSNIYEKKLISYRGITDAEALEEKRLLYISQHAQNAEDHDDENSDHEDQNEPNEIESTDFLEPGNFAQSLKLLWCYRCELSRGREVMSMTFNKANEDILAVAYGKHSSAQSEDGGLILVWSIKNPEWPERQYPTTSSVTALDFSHNNPNLLAAGFQDGRVIIYDVRTKAASQILEAGSLKHHDPVWEMKWIQKETISSDDLTDGEYLVSVSTDGRVTQWQIRKGLESSNLMLLKSANKSSSGSGPKVSSFISRQSGGLCFDFHRKDSNTYIVGTEDGFIHRCSSSYNEQYLESYSGHSGPVYKVKWSPFLSNIFLSCSADWTIRLWNEEEDTDIFRFQNGKDAVTDIAWSPTESTIFGSVSSDGRLELWDLRHSVLDPMLVQTVLDRQLTSITFGSESSVILSGDNNGVVNVYKMVKGNAHQDSKNQMEEALEHTCHNQNDLLGVYKSFDEAGVNIWSLGHERVVPDKKDDNLIYGMSEHDPENPTKRLYIYAAEYRPLSLKELTLPQTLVGNECTPGIISEDEIMNDNADDSICTDARLETSNNSLLQIESETTMSTEIPTTENPHLYESNNYIETSTGNDESNTSIQSLSPKRYSRIKIMLLDKTQKRRLLKPPIEQPKPIEPKKRVEKKPKTKMPQDHLKLRKMRHTFTCECEICGITPSFIPTCKFHNDEKFLFHRRKSMSVSENPELISKIDQILPETFHFISMDKSTAIPCFSTQWDIETQEMQVEKKKYVDLRPVYRFFRDFSTI